MWKNILWTLNHTNKTCLSSWHCNFFMKIKPFYSKSIPITNRFRKSQMEDDVHSIGILQSKIGLSANEATNLVPTFPLVLWYFVILVLLVLWAKLPPFSALSTNMLTFPLVLWQEWKLNKRPVWGDRTQKVCYVLQVVSILLKFSLGIFVGW